jgi:hypothetical protein
MSVAINHSIAANADVQSAGLPSTVHGKRTKSLDPSGPYDSDTATELVESGTEVILRGGFIARTIHLNTAREFASCCQSEPF